MRSIELLLSVLAVCCAKRLLKVDEIAPTDTPTVTTTDSNYTDEFNTTEFYATTAATTSLHNESSPNNNNVDFDRETSDYCTCDLQPDICDVNCCCDSDCSVDDKEIFGYCESEPRRYDTRYCDYMKYIYINNTRFQWEINQNGLFCVIKSNLPPSFVVQRKHPLKTFEESEKESIDRFSWPRHDREDDGHFNRSKLVYGSPVWSVNRNKLRRFGVPNSFVTDGCIIVENVNFLQDLHTSCTQVVSENNPMLSLAYYLEQAKFVSGLNTLNPLSRSKENVYEVCAKYDCLSPAIKICDGSLEKCEDFHKNDTRTSVQCNSTVCINAVRRLRYNFNHNGTKGLTDVSLSVNLGNISRESITQDFHVKFSWKNASMTTASLSGNPGYLIGRPILTATLTRNSTNFTTIGKSITNYLSIPSNINGECVMNSSHHTAIEFGFNLLTRCRFRKLIHNRRKSPNATEMCRELQNATLEIWNLLDNGIVIGLFGNANAGKSDDWERILYEESPRIACDRTRGAYRSKDSTISCGNLIKGVRIGIFHSRIDVGTLVDQRKILAVTVSFIYYNVSLGYSKADNSVMADVELETQVSFYDLTGEKTRKIVDPPSVDIKLPYDFFYPFVRINNCSVGVTCDFFVLIFNVMLVLFAQVC
ncbi:unnamed protein product [Phyllotreta striolata]|uniref:Tectonic-1-3 N-terminal domain-containing protein n=1 Tax=Phyllotreta striolata TaxID=444603 RepID=A0A9P0DQP3_PHYSR|nr:unnamed protein product [Phyllotreta striolata]